METPQIHKAQSVYFLFLPTLGHVFELHSTLSAHEMVQDLISKILEKPYLVLENPAAQLVLKSSDITIFNLFTEKQFTEFKYRNAQAQGQQSQQGRILRP